MSARARLCSAAVFVLALAGVSVASSVASAEHGADRTIAAQSAPAPAAAAQTGNAVVQPNENGWW
ncbi:hypothetical protein [Kitasatospora aureofaciens]|uniref:hypothetical protein n=1 Tax=Kitasatospora aureofaciens TaxID=1894 RepID=UPI001C46F085|nr:hypothetical protein [Kitasatospora aureofaciens]MBV6701293.1 hypothetical protein [Kitasatospora aureofaciens]